MKLTWTFYPKPGESISLTVVYVPELDGEQLSTGGFLDVLRNVAYVDWSTYRRFDGADVKSRRDAFQRLTKLEEERELSLSTGRRISLGQYQ